MILSYPLMSSTHTTRPKIKTGNSSIILIPHLPPSTQKIYHPHITLQIAPNLHTIRQNNQNEFETEFDRTLTYQHKINFLTILNHQFLPKITCSKSQYPLQNLTIYEVLSKWYHYITNLIYTQFQIIHSILILQYPKFPCHIYLKCSNHFLLKVHITPLFQSKSSPKIPISKSVISHYQEILF